MILSPTTTTITSAPSYVSSLISTASDVAFHNWCKNVGIAIHPSCKVITTEQSVAGRGVFALDDLEQGEVIAMIPNAVVFHPKNCAECFPGVAMEIDTFKERHGLVELSNHQQHRRIRQWWNQWRRKNQNDSEFLSKEDFWQPELTLYAIQAMKESHPWSEWISQWKRDDPTYNLFQKNPDVFEDIIDDTVDELMALAPYMPKLLIKAALNIRLGRWKEQQKVFPLKNDTETSDMYALLGSRAAALDDDTVGIIPFHDMLNHSLDHANVGMDLCVLSNEEHDNHKNDMEGYIELYVNRPVEKGEELFICYTKQGEDTSTSSIANSVWSLVQWGIPIPPSEHDPSVEEVVAHDEYAFLDLN
jgi:hypothetical protein